MGSTTTREIVYTIKITFMIILSIIIYKYIYIYIYNTLLKLFILEERKYGLEKDGDSRKWPAIVPRLRSPVFGPNAYSHLKYCCIHHMSHHSHHTWNVENILFSLFISVMKKHFFSQSSQKLTWQHSTDGSKSIDLECIHVLIQTQEQKFHPHQKKTHRQKADVCKFWYHWEPQNSYRIWNRMWNELLHANLCMYSS